MPRRKTHTRKVYRGSARLDTPAPTARFEYEFGGIVDSFTVVDNALVVVGNRTEDEALSKFAKGVAMLWGGPKAPHRAAEFWEQNSAKDPSDKTWVPAHLSKVGSVLGWATVIHRQPVVLGGVETDISLFSPLRRKAGELARVALVAACDGNETVYNRLCQSVPKGLVVRKVRQKPGTYSWDDQRETVLTALDFRLSEYPRRPASMHVTVHERPYDIGYYKAREEAEKDAKYNTGGGGHYPTDDPGNDRAIFTYEF